MLDLHVLVKRELSGSFYPNLHFIPGGVRRVGSKWEGSRSTVEEKEEVYHVPLLGWQASYL